MDASSKTYSISDLENLPPEILTVILLNVDLPSLLQTCSSSTTLSAFCQNEKFWKDKYVHDFGLSQSVKRDISAGKISWKELYQKEYKLQNQPISDRLSAGKFHYGWIDKDGLLYMAGNNLDFQLGINRSISNSNDLIPLSFGTRILMVSCGGIYTTVMTENGKVYMWGFFNIENKGLPREILLPSIDNVQLKAVKISTSGEYVNVLATLLSNGMVFLKYKQNNYLVRTNVSNVTATERGMISYQDNKISIWEFHQNDIKITSEITFPEKIREIVSYEYLFVAITISGKIYTWLTKYPREKGGEIYQTGRSEGNGWTTPGYVYLPQAVSSVAIGYNKNIMAIDINGDVYAWGNLNILNLDDTRKLKERIPEIIIDEHLYLGTNIYISSPLKIDYQEKFLYLTLGYGFGVAITEKDKILILGKL